jgi:hypothetical protein
MSKQPWRVGSASRILVVLSTLGMAAACAGVKLLKLCLALLPLFAWVLASSCSTGVSVRPAGSGGAATDTPTTSGSSVTGVGAGTSTGGTGGINPTGTGGAGAGLPDGGVVTDPPPPDCNTNADCPDGGVGWVCTINKKCGKIKGPCTLQSDCQADTYCCGAKPPCRADMVDMGVCVPANVPPGAPCKGALKAGIFSPALQCEWPAMSLGANDYPQHVQVLGAPVVANLPHPTMNGSGAIVFVAGNQVPGEVLGNDPNFFGVIRILRGRDCALIETIADKAAYPLRQSAGPALGDLDGDGKIDIAARLNTGGVVAFRWDGAKYARMWPANAGAAAGGDVSAFQVWDGPSIHDLDNDGKPEVLVRGAVYNGQTGALLDPGAMIGGPRIPFNGLIPVVGDLNRDGKVELVGISSTSEVTYFNWMGGRWVDNLMTFRAPGSSHFAFADFGTPGATPAQFNFKALDGIAEIVSVDDNGGMVAVYSLNSQMPVFSVGTGDRGGAPVIGDMDNDGFPEIGVAGKTQFWVLDPDCQGAGVAGCKSPGVRWSQPSQDASSAQTGASIFDFDGDKQAEVIYADECFLRVYDGKTGEVKYSSYRKSITYYENPVIADVNNDDGTKIVVNSNDIGGVVCPTGTSPPKPFIDPLDRGIRCEADADCPMGTTCGMGYCRCTATCGNDPGLACAAPPAGTAGTGNTCRAVNPNSGMQHGIRVLKDRLNRWASSRPMWNQHAYSITNINDDGTIPSTAMWRQNFDPINVPLLNNYRQNRQGASGFEDLPDITGRFADTQACVFGGPSGFIVQASVCNRGLRAVPIAVPATFYEGDPAAGKKLCTVFTNGPVPTGGGCKLIGCPIMGDIAGKQITIVVNDDGNGNRGTVECRYDNNRDQTMVKACEPPK